MSDIDQKVVQAKFEYRQFEQGVKSTLDALSNLKTGMKLTGATKGLEDINSSASKINLSGLSSAVENISHKFGALGVMAATTLATITNQAVQAGEKIIKALTLTPLQDGFKEYETKMGSIQTILANTARYHTTLGTVNTELNSLNKYADRTIYSFSEMTKNASLFTNSGMRIEDATTVIKGFSNAAAASGTKADDAARAAYQLSQAFSAGTIRLMDWRSLTNVGMGGKNMQESLIQIATAMGTLKKGSETAKLATTDFNSSLEKKWLSADVMSKYLKIMSGDMKDAELASMGLSKTQIKNLKDQAATAFDAATKVRTFTQLVGTIKEAVSSGWTDSFELIFGSFTEATDLFTNVNNVLSGFVSNSADARNKILRDWKALGGRKVLIDAISKAFHDLSAVVKPIKDAFREIFPKKTGADLFDFTVKLRDFFDKLKIGAESANNLKRTFAGVFAVFDIAKQIIGGAAHAVLDLFKSFAGGGNAGGLLSFTAGIGDFLVNLDKTLKKSGAITDFFHNLAAVLSIPIKIVVQLAKAIGNLFDRFDSGSTAKFTTGLDDVNKKLNPLAAAGKKIHQIFQALGDMFKSIGTTIGNSLKGIGDAITKVFTPETFSMALGTINTALLGGIVLMLRKFFNGGMKVNVDASGGLFKSIKGALDGVTESLTVMQTSVKVDMVLKIAAALALLTASILVLSTIKPTDLAKSLAAMAVGLGLISAVMVQLTKSISLLGAAKLPFIAAGLLGISASMLLMATAVKIMATMNMGDMLRGLTGLAIGLKIISVTMKSMPKGMVAQAAALTLLGIALNEIALALKLFGTISWDAMAHGMAAMAGALVIIAGAMHLMPRSMVLQAAGLTILAVALNGIALALKLFGTISWDAMVHGLAALAGTLIIIAGAIALMPPTMALQAAGLVLVAGALNVMAGALMLMGSMSWEAIGKGLVTLAGSLAILAAGLALMTGSLLGSAALLVAAGALAILTPVLIALGSLSWGTILTGLGAMAGMFVILGAAGYLLAPVVVVIIGLGAAFVLLGAGLALAGVGAMAFASAYAIVTASAAVGVSVLASILKTFVDSIPGALKAFGLGVVAFARAIATGGPAFFLAFSTILQAILKSIITNVPLIGKAFLTLVNTGLTVLVVAVPRMASAGLQMLVGLLTAISNNIGRIIPIVVSIITKFIDGVSAGLPRIIEAGVKLIINFVNGLSKAIDEHSKEMGEAGGRLAVAIVEGMAKGIAGGVGVIGKAVKGLADHAINSAKSFLGIHSPSKEFEKIGNFVNEGFAKGLRGNQDEVLKAYTALKDLLAQANKDAVDDANKAKESLAKLSEARRKDTIAVQNAAFAVSQAKDKLAELTSAHKKDHDAIVAAQHDVETAEQRLTNLTHARDEDIKKIKETQAALAEAVREQKLTHEAYAKLTTQVREHRLELEHLATDYEALGVKLDAANKVLEDAIKTRDDYMKSVTDQYGSLGDINKDTTLESYLTELQGHIDSNTEFSTALQHLRDLGLSDEMYKKLLTEGIDALPFVHELEQGGTAAITTINTLGATLAATAKTLGTTASKEMYQAGVDTAQGLVKGIQSQQAAIQAEIDAIAAKMVLTMNKALHIKSPSRIFMKIGSYTGEGLAIGLKNSSAGIEAVANTVGQNAIDAMRQSMAKMSNMIDGHMDLNPTITPVLDLSLVKRDAMTLGSMLPAHQISVDAAYMAAKSASAAYTSNQQTVDPVAAGTAGADMEKVVFNQYNTSPKALSAAELYRQTNNQLSKAKRITTLKGALAK